MRLEIDFHELSGLSPKTWLSVGPGFAHEELKELALRETGGFTASAITTVQELCRKLLAAHAEEPGALSADHVLNSLTRQEALRSLLAEPRISARMRELKRLRRQSTFFKKLDLAIQAGRLLFAHEQELAVLNEKLNASVGPSPLREEISALAGAYEAWLQGSGLWDPPLLIRQARDLLEERGWPEGLEKPDRILHFSTQAEESLEKSFWEALSRCTQVEKIGFASWENEASSSRPDLGWSWERWHTLDDAAEDFVERLLSRVKSPADWGQLAVLIPDIPSVRRSLLRALDGRKVPLADPRDPSRLRWDESLKAALLPLELVAGNYKRDGVLAWISLNQKRLGIAKSVELVREIHIRGVRDGLFSYLPRSSGVDFQRLHAELENLQHRFGGKKTARELGEAHLAWVEEAGRDHPDLALLGDFCRAFWTQLCEDLDKVHLSERRGAPLYWLERLRTRLAEMSPPVERLKPQAGLRIFRLQQAPIDIKGADLFFFGLPAQWLATDTGDYWFNARERDLLGSEFPVRSSRQLREERLAVLKKWVESARSISFLDADYSEDGRERETLEPLLTALGCPLAEATYRGAHARWLASYSAVRPVPPLEIQLPPVPARAGEDRPVLSATALDRFSRCAFQGLALQRWKLWDLRDPGLELWPEVRGTMLHDAVKILLRSRDTEGNFGVFPREALDQAWKERPPKGFFRSRRTEEYEKLRATLILEIFCAKEREYLKRAGTRTISLEELKVRLEYPDFIVVGEPDRIEEHPDGLFVSDFKTGSGQPHGLDIVSKGYRLQLPFYALGIQKQLGKPVLGVQFIELTRQGTRSSGIFFEKWNGKEAGKLTDTKPTAKSVFREDPDEIWSRVEEKIVEHARAYLKGTYRVAPKKDSECRGCAAADLCGAKRLAASGMTLAVATEESEAEK